MKEGLKRIPLLFCFAVVLTSSLVLTQRAAASGTDTEHVTFTEPLTVAGTMLEPGAYKLVWDDGASQVQVSFMKGSKTIVTAPATLVREEGKYHGAVELRVMGDNSKVLEKITWKKKTLVFQPSS